MKIAVFKNRYDGEVVILAIKGRGNSKDDVDGFKDYFEDNNGRSIYDYDVSFAHIGAGSGIIISCIPKVVIDRTMQNGEDITDWFYSDEECPFDRK